MTGAKDNHRMAMDFAGWLSRNYSGEKILVFPVCRENSGEAEAVYNWCAKSGFRLNLLLLPGHHKKAQSLPDCQILIREISSLPLKEVILDVPLLGLSGHPNLCPGGRLAMFAGVRGEIKPCPYFPPPLCRLEEDVLKAWSLLKEEVARLNQSCSLCDRFSLCGGGCLANKSDGGKDCYCPVR